MRRSLLCFLAAFCLSSADVAGQEPPLCGTLTHSTRLKSDCRAPLIIGADRIKVDLGGRKVLCPEGMENSHQRGIILEGRRDVVVQNGVVRCGYGLTIHGGEANTVSRLDLEGQDYEGRAIDMKGTRANRLHHVKARSGFDGRALVATDSHNNRFVSIHFSSLEIASVIVRGNNNLISQSHLDVQAIDSSAMILVGNGNVIERSKLNISTLGHGIHMKGDGGMISRLDVRGAHIGIYLEGNRGIVDRNLSYGNDSGIAIKGVGNLIRNNTAIDNTTADLADYSPNCADNTWRHNTFQTDREGDGPERGCIR